MLTITYSYRNQQNCKYVIMLNYISANMITNNYASRFLCYVFCSWTCSIVTFIVNSAITSCSKIGFMVCLVNKYKYIKLYTMRQLCK